MLVSTVSTNSRHTSSVGARFCSSFKRGTFQFAGKAFSPHLKRKRFHRKGAKEEFPCGPPSRSQMSVHHQKLRITTCVSLVTTTTCARGQSVRGKDRVAPRAIKDTAAAAWRSRRAVAPRSSASRTDSPGEIRGAISKIVERTLPDSPTQKPASEGI